MKRVPSAKVWAATTAACFASLAFFPLNARADDGERDLETLELRQSAQEEGERLLSTLSKRDQAKLRGTYVAFNGSASDPSATVGCDDDGDHVIVVSDALLWLASSVARAQSYNASNESYGSLRIEEYADFMATAQRPGRRLLPPPKGFHATASASTGYERLLREAISFILSREVSYLRAGEISCPHPSATHEDGDDTWTPAEERSALDQSHRIARGRSPERERERDLEAALRVLDLGRSIDGGLGLIQFFSHFDDVRRGQLNRLTPRYLIVHPNPRATAAALREASTMREATASRGSTKAPEGN